ncbi:TPA: hypothetical protein ACP7VI_004853, partial [Escherichia coli]
IPSFSDCPWVFHALLRPRELANNLHYFCFAIIVLNKFILKPKRCPTFILNTTSSAGNNLIPVLGSYNR